MSVNAVNSVNVPTANGPAAPPKSKVFDRLVSPLFQTDGFIGQAKVGALNGAMVGAGAMGAMGAFFSTKRANIGKATVTGLGTGIVVGAVTGAASRMGASAITNEHKALVGAAIGAVVMGVGMRLLGGKGSTGISQVAIGAATGFFSSL